MWPFGSSAEKRLRDALAEYETTKDLPLEVDVRGKTAVFRGEVELPAQRAVLQGVARGIRGIDEVDLDGVTVRQPDDAREVADPSALAKAVHARIQQRPELADDPLEVLQKGDTVVLRGAVGSAAERDAAVELARGTDGVRGVDAEALRVVADAKALAATNDRGEVVYEVTSGDTLSEIAQKYYGDGGRAAYMKIAEANGLDDPDLIRVGQKLVIPGTPDGPDRTLA